MNVRALCMLYGLLMGPRARYSRDTEGNFDTMRLTDKLWWGYKRYVRQVECAERGSGIEAHFEGQRLRPQIPDGFRADADMTLTAGGDLMAKPFLTPQTIRRAWDDVAGFYFDADVVLANLESPVTGWDPSYAAPSARSTPAMNNSPAMLEAFYRGGKGITLFTTANNHCLDQGPEGLISTLDALDALGCAHTGTARSERERDDVLIIEKNGVRTAFLAYTFSTNGKPLPEKRPYAVNCIRLNTKDADLSLVRRQVEAAREKSADFVVILPHWSLEYELFPTRTVMNTARRLAALGADAVIGNHPHSVQPIEWLRATDPYSGREKDCLVVYALGNLLGDSLTKGNWNLENLVKLRLSKGTLNGRPEARITDFDILPVYATVVPEGAEGPLQRLLPMQWLMATLRAGVNLYGLDDAAQREAFRLEELMVKVLEPAILAGRASAWKEQC